MKPSPLNETQLVCKLQAGCGEAFTALYDAYAATLFGVLLRLVKNQELAKDLLQDTFIKIWTNMDRYDAQQGRLFTWLLVITRNVAMDAIRARKAHASYEAYRDDQQTASFCFINEAMPHQSVFNMLAPHYGRVLELTYQGYTKKEIAQKFNLPLGTVKTRFRTGIYLLKAIFQQDIHQYHLS